MTAQTKGAEELRIIAWNANSIVDKTYELEEFATRMKADIILVSETFLKPHHQDPRLRNFFTYRCDRDGLGGGTAIFVRRSLDHSGISSPVLQNLEACSVIVNTTELGPIKIIAAYNSPSKELLPADLDQIFDTPMPTIVAGDLNAKHSAWHCRTTNRRGKVLFKYASKKELEVCSPEEPTYFSAMGHQPDILDIAVLQNVNCDCLVSTVNDLSSDHNPIILDIGAQSRIEKPVKKNTDWEKFPSLVTEFLGPLPNITNKDALDQAVNDLTTAIKRALDEASRPKSSNYQTPTQPPETISLIKQRHRARRTWHITRDPADKRLYNRLTTQIRDALKQRRNEDWQNALQEADDDDTTLWRISKALRKRRAPPFVIHGARGLAYTAQDKAEAIADSIEEQCSPNYENMDVEFAEHVHRTVRQKLRTAKPEPIQFCTPSEIQSILQKTKLRKAPGPDGITAAALRKMPRKAVVALTNIINSILRLHHFPAAWKEATVITIPKPGKDAKFPQNHRPISLLNLLAKVAEQILLQQIEKHTHEFGILPPDQFGFRRKHSTVQQLVRVVDFATQGFEFKMSTGAVFLDVQKTFDKVWHRGLLYKLIALNYPIGLVLTIQSYLENRCFRVKHDGALSRKRYTRAGVAQGSPISPILFNIYASDLPSTPQVLRAKYADDTAYAARHRNVKCIIKRLQQTMEEVEEWCCKWRTAVNAEKSTAILFTRRRVSPTEQIRLFDRQIPWRDTATYLGVELDRRLTFKAHITNSIAKARQTTGRLLPLLGRRSDMNLANKLRLYKSVIRPQLLYGSPAWGIASAAQLKRLQTQQNKTLRIIVNAQWYITNNTIHADTKTPHLNEVMRKQAVLAFTAMGLHNNEEVRRAADFDVSAPVRHRRPMHQLLDAANN